MPEDIFITYPAKVAFKTYQTRWQLGDIYISGNAKLVLCQEKVQIKCNQFSLFL